MYNRFAPTKRNDASNESRFLSRDELKYAIRSIEKYANWTRKIYIVSNCSAPNWLNIKSEKVIWVDHKEIIDNEFLPTFNSHVIETFLHKIDGLSNYFIYANDDIILTRPVEKFDFFEPNGNCKLKLEPYGNVIGNQSPGLPDYLNASLNSQNILYERFGCKPTQLHRHTHQALRKDIISEIEVEFQDAFYRTRKSRFRNIEDINLTSFLFHHYAYYSGKAIKVYPRTNLIKSNSNYIKTFQDLIVQQSEIFFSSTSRAMTACINDGHNSHNDINWNHSIVAFLETYLPQKSSCEK